MVRYSWFRLVGLGAFALIVAGCTVEQPRSVLQYHQTDDTLIAPAAIAAVLAQIPRSEVDLICVYSSPQFGVQTWSLDRWTIYAIQRLDERVLENKNVCDEPAMREKGDRVIRLLYRNGVHNLVWLGSAENQLGAYNALLAKLDAGHAVADITIQGCRWGWYSVELAHTGQGKFEVVKLDHATPRCVQ